MIKLKELNNYYFKNNKKIKLSKLTAVTALSSLMFLTSCTKEPVPPVEELTEEEKMIIETNKRALEGSQIEVVPIEEVFSETPEIIVINGIEYKFEEYKKELKVPFLYEKINKEDIEEIYANIIDLVEKTRYTVAVNSGYKDVENWYVGTPFYQNNDKIVDEDIDYEWADVFIKTIEQFGHEIYEGNSPIREYKLYFKYDEVNEEYQFIYNPGTLTLIEKEIYIKLFKQHYANFLKFAKEKGIEYEEISYIPGVTYKITI